MTKAQLEQKVGELETSIKGLREDIMIIVRLGNFASQAGNNAGDPATFLRDAVLAEQYRSFWQRYNTQFLGLESAVCAFRGFTIPDNPAPSVPGAF